MIVAPRMEPIKRTARAEQGLTTHTASDGRTFMLPPTSLLSEPAETVLRIDEQTLKDNAVRLVEKLAAYGVTRPRRRDPSRARSSRCTSSSRRAAPRSRRWPGLSDDLALALAAEKVRIVAPIPGKARVGFELPNKHRQTVQLRELLEDERWQKLDGPAAGGASARTSRASRSTAT